MVEQLSYTQLVLGSIPSNHTRGIEGMVPTGTPPNQSNESHQKIARKMFHSISLILV